eukprot:CAMPEP_0197939856 /NCGR_PEP_ID=MMETSP1439-20131203/120326_1 /TAXON_ID=66791 /ORGANISM="Gonyaulax spinifera, Strain CCMP409" /LENGTH=159 /DNA_ID=CAMNT_0043562999 /DNA_START=65 /DNA_END=541 /DNA_ORIENTATION=-
MSAVHGDYLAACQATNEVPVGLRIAETQPTMNMTVLRKVDKLSASWHEEERLARVAVVEGALPMLEVGGLSPLRLLVQKSGRLPVSVGLGLLAIEIADSVRKLPAATPAQLLLHAGLRRPMSLRPHDAFVAHDAGRREGRGAQGARSGKQLQVPGLVVL